MISNLSFKSPQREINEKKTNETRLYISSLNDEAEAFNKYIRMHWGVENSLHWTLDMTFREDEQRKRDKNSAQNFAIVRKIVEEHSGSVSLRSDPNIGTMVTVVIPGEPRSGEQPAES